MHHEIEAGIGEGQGDGSTDPDTPTSDEGARRRHGELRKWGFTGGANRKQAAVSSWVPQSMGGRVGIWVDSAPVRPWGDRVFDSMDKALLKERFTGLLRDRRDTLAGVQADARAGTRVDGDHRPENRGERAAVTSQGYLAHGLTARMAELDTMLEALALVRTGPCARIASGALVRLADEADEERLLYILPGGQGDRLGPVVVVSPRAPIVRALSGAGGGRCPRAASPRYDRVGGSARDPLIVGQDDHTPAESRVC